MVFNNSLYIGIILPTTFLRFHLRKSWMHFFRNNIWNDHIFEGCMAYSLHFVNLFIWPQVHFLSIFAFVHSGLVLLRKNLLWKKYLICNGKDRSLFMTRSWPLVHYMKRWEISSKLLGYKDYTFYKDCLLRTFLEIKNILILYKKFIPSFVVEIKMDRLFVMFRTLAQIYFIFFLLN